MTKPDPTVLLADDQADVREALRLLLKSDGLASVATDGPGAVLEALRKREFACALIEAMLLTMENEAMNHSSLNQRTASLRPGAAHGRLCTGR